jgi:CRP/FNR family cyclic AMP-dependent transcriptional regulator
MQGRASSYAVDARPSPTAASRAGDAAVYNAAVPLPRFGYAMGPRIVQDRQELLKSHFLLGKLGDTDIAALLAHAHSERFATGEEIFAKDSPGQSMMAVLSGSVKITSSSSEGREIVFSIMGPGEIFGEIALLDGLERTADATAVTDCELLVILRRDFLPLLQRRTDICIMLLELLCQKLRRTSEQVEDVSFEHLNSRVAKALLRLALPAGVGGNPAVLRVTQRELGHMVGGSRESVNRLLQVWQKTGLVELSKGTIAIRDLEGMQRLV